jgi:hypothetical protein
MDANYNQLSFEAWVPASYRLISEVYPPTVHHACILGGCAGLSSVRSDMFVATTVPDSRSSSPAASMERWALTDDPSESNELEYTPFFRRLAVGVGCAAVHLGLLTDFFALLPPPLFRAKGASMERGDSYPPKVCGAGSVLKSSEIGL